MKVTLEAIKGEKTRAEITAKYSVHAKQINTWKKQAIEIMPEELYWAGWKCFSVFGMRLRRERRIFCV